MCYVTQFDLMILLHPLMVSEAPVLEISYLILEKINCSLKDEYKL